MHVYCCFSERFKFICVDHHMYRQWTKVFARFQFTLYISYKTTVFQNIILKSIFKIIFYDKHFENIQAKHTTELISFEIQCFDMTFVDKLFKSVFKSWRFAGVN
jgi:hypothetical protein